MLEPTGNLLWRPQHPELLGHDARQRPVLAKLAALGTMSTIPCGLIGLTRPIALLSTVALDLAADGGCRSAEKSSDCSDRSTCHHIARDLLALGQGQRHFGPVPLCWTDATGGARIPRNDPCARSNSLAIWQSVAPSFQSSHI